MVAFGGTFDATQVEPREDFETLPAGDYPVQIMASEMRDNSAGTGSYLLLEMEVTDGVMKGRKLWDRLNLDHPNGQAVEIAQRTLSAICHAVGVLSVSDSEQLHFKPMLARVKVVPRKQDGRVVEGQYNNEIGSYKPLGGASGGGFSGNAGAGASGSQAGGSPAADNQQGGGLFGKGSRPAAGNSGGGGSSTPPWKRQQG